MKAIRIEAIEKMAKVAVIPCDVNFVARVFLAISTINKFKESVDCGEFRFPDGARFELKENVFKFFEEIGMSLLDEDESKE